MASTKDPFEFQGTCLQIHATQITKWVSIQRGHLLELEILFFSLFFSLVLSGPVIEFEEGDNLLHSNSDTVAVNIEDPGPQKEKQDDEDPDVTDDQTKVWTRTCGSLHFNM